MKDPGSFQEETISQVIKYSTFLEHLAKQRLERKWKNIEKVILKVFIN